MMEAKIFREHLENDIISFWNRMKDEENGGFYGCADSEGVPDKKSVKGVILHSRILWFYSSAYQLLKNPELLKMADHAYNFLTEYCLDRQHGGIYWSVAYDGEVEDDTKHTYNQAFAIYALSAYYQAGKRKDALDLAYMLYRMIEEKCRDESGYLEAFHRDFTPASNEKLSENGVLAERTMNTLLHVLEAYTELYKADVSDEVNASIREILRLFKEKVYNTGKLSCEVFFDKEYHSLIELESYGHNIEASWLIKRACSVLGDEKCLEEMLPMINGLAEGALLNGLDKASYAMNNECERGAVDCQKIWWVQAESVVGFYNAYQENLDKTEYRDSAEKVWEYIQKFVIDKNTGEWIESISADNKILPNQALAHAWKCPYHNGRMCIEMIQRLSSEKWKIDIKGENPNV